MRADKPDGAEKERGDRSRLTREPVPDPFPVLFSHMTSGGRERLYDFSTCITQNLCLTS